MQLICYIPLVGSLAAVFQCGIDGEDMASSCVAGVGSGVGGVGSGSGVGVIVVGSVFCIVVGTDVRLSDFGSACRI